jgi:hypothetical protein
VESPASAHFPGQESAIPPGVLKFVDAENDCKHDLQGFSYDCKSVTYRFRAAATGEAQLRLVNHAPAGMSSTKFILNVTVR